MPPNSASPGGNDETGADDVVARRRVLEWEYENAKQRLTEQRETIKSFSMEGRRFLRLLLLIVGAPVAILGALNSNALTGVGETIVSDTCTVESSSVCLSIGTISAGTGLALIFSGLLNVLAGGFEARGVYNLSNPNDIKQAVTAERSVEAHLGTRLKQYQDRIKHNDRVINALESILALGKFTLTLGISGIGIIAYRVLFGFEIPLGWVFALFLVFLSVIGIFRLLTPREYSAADKLFGFNPVYRNATGDVENQLEQAENPRDVGAERDPKE